MEGGEEIIAGKDRNKSRFGLETVARRFGEGGI
jgi:hypothetical protein